MPNRMNPCPGIAMLCGAPLKTSPLPLKVGRDGSAEIILFHIFGIATATYLPDTTLFFGARGAQAHLPLRQLSLASGTTLTARFF